jgi:anionic cell wall polymer biosynthesis LytR-Cps2A-Psr (LCP) family protein
MIKLLKEEIAAIYRGFVRITYTDEYNISQVADYIRSVEGVTIVSTAGSDETNKVTTLKVKIRTTLKGEEAFKYLRSRAIKFPGISRFEIGTNSIERIE